MFPPGFDGPPTPEQIEQMQQQARKFALAEADAEAAHRARMWRFAAIICTCKPRYIRCDQETPPGHANCLLHGQFMITYDGKIL
jgi:hypothetical protein